MELSIIEKKELIKRHSYIIELIRHNDFIDMKSISIKSEYSWPTVRNAIDILIENKVLSYDDNRNTVKRYFPNGDFGYFLSIAVGATETKISLVDFNFEPVELLSKEFKSEFGNIVGNLENRIGESLSTDYLCFKTKRSYLAITEMCSLIVDTFLDAFNVLVNKDLLSIGISLPGIVNKETNLMEFCPNIPELVNVNVSKLLRPNILRRIDQNNISLYVCHDTIAATVYERERLYQPDNDEHIFKDCSNIAVLYLGSGFGAGYILQNRLVLGASGAVGEIGHFHLGYNDLSLTYDDNSKEAQLEKNDRDRYYIKHVDFEFKDTDYYDNKSNYEKNVNINDGICMCGKKECLERLIRIKVFNAKDLDDFIKKTSKEELKVFATNHPYRYRVLKHLLGQVLNITVNMLNVELIALTGRILNGIPELKQEIESLTIDNTLRVSSKYCHTLTASGRADSVAIGAAIMSYYNIINDLSKEDTINW